MMKLWITSAMLAAASLGCAEDARDRHPGRAEQDSDSEEYRIYIEREEASVASSRIKLAGTGEGQSFDELRRRIGDPFESIYQDFALVSVIEGGGVDDPNSFTGTVSFTSTTGKSHILEIEKGIFRELRAAE